MPNTIISGLTSCGNQTHNRVKNNLKHTLKLFWWKFRSNQLLRPVKVLWSLANETLRIQCKFLFLKRVDVIGNLKIAIVFISSNYLRLLLLTGFHFLKNFIMCIDIANSYFPKVGMSKLHQRPNNGVKTFLN